MTARKAKASPRAPYVPRPYEKTPEELRRRAEELGAADAVIISPKNVTTAHWVRARCQFGCGGFGGSLVCPPYSWRPEETRKLLDEYDTAVIVHCRPGTNVKELVVKLEREAFLANYYKAFSYGSGPCFLCDECAFDEGCRHPREARPAMEASGIDVFKTARDAGLPIDVCRTREDDQHHYGLVLLK